MSSQETLGAHPFDPCVLSIPDVPATLNEVTEQMINDMNLRKFKDREVNISLTEDFTISKSLNEDNSEENVLSFKNPDPEVLKAAIENMNSKYHRNIRRESDSVMPKVKIIAATGPKHVGKTYFMRKIQEQIPEAIILSFAGPLKDSLFALGVPHKSLYGTSAEKEAIIDNLGVSGRQLMQGYGMMLREQWKNYNPDYPLISNAEIWTTLMYNRIVSLPDDSVVLIDDLRMPDEFRVLSELGAEFVFLSSESTKPIPGTRLPASESYFEEFRDRSRWHFHRGERSEPTNEVSEHSDFTTSAVDEVVNWINEQSPHEINVVAEKPASLLLGPAPSGDVISQQDFLFPEMYELARKQAAGKWEAEDFDFHEDAVQFKKLSRSERSLLAVLTAFFAHADKIIADEYCCASLQALIGHHPDIGRWLAEQAAIEFVHGVTYANMLNQLLPADYRNAAINAVKKASYAPVAVKIQFMRDHMTPDTPLSRLLFFGAFAEGIWFSASFTLLFYIGRGGKGKLKQSVAANAPISRDEGLHAVGNVTMYNRLLADERLSKEDAFTIARQMTESEITFARSMFNGHDILTGEFLDEVPEFLRGLLLSDVEDYIRFLANILTTNMGYGRVFPDAPEINPCPHMAQNDAENKVNSFESTGANYQAKPPAPGTFMEQRWGYSGDIDALGI